MRRNCSVVVHGVDVAALGARRGERSAARAANDWAATDVVIAIVANLRSGKDYPTLIEAAEQAVAAEPSLRFVSIGQGPLERELRARVARSTVSSRFEMLGYHEDPPAVLVGADAFTLSSRTEGLSIALLEAMALGLPAVVTDVGANRAVVGDDGGIVVSPSDPGALAAGYIRMAREPEVRSKMGLAASLRAERYDIRRAARLLESRYRSLLARPGHGGGGRPTAPRAG
jgi:glycosyltransferase involved in cell wall biosynthesis